MTGTRSHSAGSWPWPGPPGLLRVVALPTAQTAALATAVREQAARPWSPAQEQAEQDALYAAWSSDRLREHPAAVG